MAENGEKISSKPQNTRRKNKEDVNSIINEVCAKIKAPTFTRTVSQLIFQKANFLLGTTNQRKLAITSVHLASKITDIYNENDLFKSVMKDSFDSNLEIKICQALDFSFDYIDIYLLVKEICKAIHKEETLEERLNKLDKVFSCEKINQFSPLYGSPEGPYLAFAVFEDQEINLLESINCIEIDMSLVANAKKILTDQ